MCERGGQFRARSASWWRRVKRERARGTRIGNSNKQAPAQESSSLPRLSGRYPLAQTVVVIVRTQKIHRQHSLRE